MVYGPGQHDTDLSLAKKFDFPLLADVASGEFRAQAFNLFNSSQFANPANHFWCRFLRHHLLHLRQRSRAATCIAFFLLGAC